MTSETALQRMKRRFIEGLLGLLLIAVLCATTMTFKWAEEQVALYIALGLAMFWAFACEWRQSKREKT